MNSKRFLSILAALVLLLNLVACQSAYGQPRYVQPYSPAEWRHSVKLRIDEAHARIDRGVANGALTRREAADLREDIAVIQSKIARMSRDGPLRLNERAIINDDLDDLRRRIYVEKHDRQQR